MTIFGSMSGRTTNKFNKILSQLHQEVINARMDNNEVFDNGENNLPENIDNLNIEMIRDLGTTSTLKNVSNIHRLVTGADYNDILRIHLKFTNAGKLYDYARNNNTSWVFGLGQIPILIKKKVSDNVLGYEFQSFFNGQDQYAYTEDNTLVQIRPFFDDVDLTDISFFDSFSPISISHTVDTENSILFTKVDDDQLKDGYAATINNKGDIFFYIRRNFKQYSLFIKGIYFDQLQDELNNAGDFLGTNFNSFNYRTDKEYTSNLVCSIVKTDDHWFCYKKSTNAMKYIKNGIDLTPTGFSVSPILDVPFQDGAYNTDGTDRTIINDISSGNYNGTLVNPENGQWQTNNTFLSFGSNTAGNGGGIEITFPTISDLDNANEYTVSFMYKPDSSINTKSYSTWIVNKSYANNGSWVIYRTVGTSDLRLEFKSLNATFHVVTFTNAFPIAKEWYSIIAKFKSNEPIELIVNGVSATGTVLPANINTVGTLKLFRVNTSDRGIPCYFRVFTSKLGAVDTQRLLDEGYHNPTFPKAEKPQPEPDPTPPPVTNPFEVFYNLPTGTLNDANTVWLNDPAGSSPFTPFYNVTEGEDNIVPEQLIYDVDYGISSGSEDPFEIQYNLSSSDNSTIQLGDDENDAGGVGVQSGSTLIGLKITKAHFYLKSENSPSGSVYCRIWDANDNIVVTLQRWNGSGLETLNASDIPTDYQEYEFRNTTFDWGANSVQVGWTIGIEYVTSNDSHRVHIRRVASNEVANEIQHSRDTGTSQFDTNSSFDVAAKLYTGGGTTSTDPFVYMKHASLSPYDRVTQKFGNGDSCLNSKPTKIKVKLKRTGTCNGTIKVDLVTAYNGTSLVTFGSGISASSISTTETEYTFTNLSNTEAILSGYVIRVYWEGLTSSSTGTIGVLSNSGVVDDHNGTTSHLQSYGGFNLTNYTSLDLGGKIYVGGTNFIAHRDFSSSLSRVYAKVAHTSSTLNGKKMTKIIGRMKKVGSPTGFMTCNVRKLSDDSVRFSLGSVDVTSISDAMVVDVEFMNVFNDLQTQLDDRICFEYLGADVTNYIEVYINEDVFETTNTISGTFSSPVYSDDAQIDLAGKMYTGGEPDVDSRTRVGQKIITNNESIMDGKKLTKIGVWLRNPNGAVGNIHCMIFRASDDVQPIVTLGDPIGASTIGTSFEFVEFEDTTNGYVMDVNDKVCIQFESGSPDQQIGVHVREGTNHDSTHSHLVRYNGETFDDMLTWDLVATMWTGGDEYQPPANAIPDPTPTNNKDLLYCAGNNLLSGFARVLQREFAIYVEDTTEVEADNVYTNRYSKTSRSPQEVLTAGSFKPY